MTAGYSGTPLVRKLGYKPGQRAFVEHAPGGYLDLLGGTPEGVTFVDEADAADLVHVFTTSVDELRERLTAYRPVIATDGMVWVSWPKRASKVPTDISDNVVREVALPMGYVDVKVCAVDDTWSGLKLVIRKELR